MDISIGIDRLLDGAKYLGTFEQNTEEEYDSIVWIDERSKPPWNDIVSAYSMHQHDVYGMRIKQERNRLLYEIYDPAVLQIKRELDKANHRGLDTSTLENHLLLWHMYADALCDIPEQEGFPWGGVDDPNVPWPTPPSSILP